MASWRTPSDGQLPARAITPASTFADPLNPISFRRVAFLMQSPLLIGALIIMYLYIREPASSSNTLSARQKLARIDYLGSLTLVGSIGCLLLGMSLKTTQRLAWTEPKVLGLLIARSVQLSSACWMTILGLTLIYRLQRRLHCAVLAR